LERRSNLLLNLELFLVDFESIFGNPGRSRIAATKIRALHQGSRAASVYASEFRQISSDLTWGDEALMNQFLTGLSSDVKDLLITFPDPDTLTGAIADAVKCDNRLFERRQECRLELLNTSGSGSLPPHSIPCPCNEQDKGGID
jgi:hypothetical protein